VRKLIVAAVFAIMAAGPALAQGAPPPPEIEAGGDLLAIVALPARSDEFTEIDVMSGGWPAGGDIPFKYTQYEGNEFPGLNWTDGPEGTQSYAIIMQDSDLVVRGAPILHWSVVNIPASVTSLKVGMKPEEKPVGAIYGPNYKGAAQPYLGPRTPPGPKHRYHVQVLALDTLLPADFAPKSYDELIAPLKGHVLASGSVMGLGQQKK
jgi:Raf kinase inhibitor-like YbhB/YbcL family protein